MRAKWYSMIGAAVPINTVGCRKINSSLISSLWWREEGDENILKLAWEEHDKISA